MEVELCNRALMLLGHGGIESLDEGSPAADACRVHFHPVRRKLLRGALWGCARKIDTPPQIGDWNGPQSWPYAFLYPQDAIVVWFIEPVGGKFPAFTTLVHNGAKVLATTTTSPVVHYVYDSTDYHLWDSMFTDAFVNALASVLAVPITGQADLGSYFHKKAQAAVLEAQAIASNELVRTWKSARTTPSYDIFAGAKDPFSYSDSSVDSGGFGNKQA